MEHNISISRHSNLGPQFKMLKCTIWNENSDSQVTNIMASSKLNIRNLEAPMKLEKNIHTQLQSPRQNPDKIMLHKTL